MTQVYPVGQSPVIHPTPIVSEQQLTQGTLDSTQRTMYWFKIGGHFRYPRENIIMEVEKTRVYTFRSARISHNDADLKVVAWSYSPLGL